MTPRPPATTRPLGIDVDGTRKVFGVASWVFTGPVDPCMLGTAHAAFGPRALPFVASALADDCLGVTNAGKCSADATTAKSCVVDPDGTRSRQVTDCTAAAQKCSTAGGTASCQ